MRTRLTLLLVNLALLAAMIGSFMPDSWPDGH
jgi:hypothetical protein